MSKLSSLLALLLVVTAVGCGVGNGIEVRNSSGIDLEDVTLFVGSESLDLGSLSHKESKSVSIVPDRDASIRLCIRREGVEACGNYGYVTRNLHQSHRFEILPNDVRYSRD